MIRIGRLYAGLAVLYLSCAVSPAHVIAKSGWGSAATHALKQATSPAAQQAPSEPLRTASDRPISIRNIKLDLRVDMEKKTVDSKANIQFQCIKPTHTLSLDAVGFEVKKVTLTKGDGASGPAKYLHDGKKLVIDLGSRWASDQAGSVNIEYVVKQPKDGLHFFSPGKTSPDVPSIVWSQGETTTNRFWFPCIDEPDQRQTTQIVATVPLGYEAVSNGKLLSRFENASDKTVTFDWIQDKPHAAYLVTLVVGQFDVVEEQWNGIPVQFYVPKGRKAEALPTYGKTRDMLTFFSKRFGITYPWDKYAQVSAYNFGGGMENTSATTMGDGILRDERSLLDGNSESIVSHELAHQWWGDMVTCRDWSHTWLNEGFASYAEALWDEHARGADEYALNMYQKAGGAIAGGKTRPIMDRRYLSPDSMFDGRSYPKGAWVLHMLRNRLGDEAFFKGLKQYGTEHKFKSVETGDFRRTLEQVSNRDLERFFYDWLERAGSPDIEVVTEYLPEAKKVQIAVKQTQAGEPFTFPVKIALYCEGAKEPILLEDEMTGKELSLQSVLPGKLLRVEFDPDQAVLSTIKETKSRELWQDQLLHGSTVPLRLRATQHFAGSKEKADHELLLTAYQQEKFHDVKRTLANAVGDTHEPAAKEALLQGLLDPDARLRRACVTNLGKFKNDEKVAEVIRGILQKGEPSLGVESAAIEAYAKLGQKDALELITPWLAKTSHQHALANAALLAIGSLHDPATVGTLITWSEPGHPSSSRGAAQRALIQLVRAKKLNDEQKQQVLQSFITVLESDDRFLQFGVINALPELGPMAEKAIPSLEKLSFGPAIFGNGQEMVKNAIAKIKSSKKPAVEGGTDELRKARAEVEKLQQEVDALRKRLEKKEKAEKP